MATVIQKTTACKEAVRGKKRPREVAGDTVRDQSGLCAQGKFSGVHRMRELCIINLWGVPFVAQQLTTLD